MKVPISIIIPTRNEAKYLPKLLQSISSQSVLPHEIILVDAFSQDNTVKIAQKFGCKVILHPSWISGARNIGAKEATQPILLFLDSDVILPKLFLEKAFFEFVDRKLTVASCFIIPLSKLKRDIFMHEAVNYYFRLTKNFHPHGPGFCIFITKQLHRKIEGFDEKLVLAEDHDYIKRAKKEGKFGYLRCYKIPVSVRRLSEEGRTKLAIKYITAELHLLLLGKIKKHLFPYEFGNHHLE